MIILLEQKLLMRLSIFIKMMEVLIKRLFNETMCTME